MRRFEEGIRLALSNRPRQAAVSPHDPVLLLDAMGAVGPGLEEDIVIESVQLGSRGSTPVTVLLRNMPFYDQWVDGPVDASATGVPFVQP
ncbi:hypothetical protein O988_02689 [Pseudogymnoascus sp. VKM F-3808]|nr:hypothetical protein O988_02689 [Pseudogymnoascus sp. VKM F-3808]